MIAIIRLWHWLPLGLASFLPILVVAADAPLSVEPSVFHMKPTIEQTGVFFTVTAKNTSARTVDVTEYRGGCGCITFSSPTTVLAPGETMDVVVTFDFKDFTGHQKRTLSILTTSAGSPEPVKNSFQLVGEIPTAIQFSKKAAIWLYGEKPTTKEISVTVKPEYEIVDLHVEDSKLNHFIKVEQSPSDDGRQLTVRVTPTSTSIDEVSPAEKANLQVPYVVKYKTQNGAARYERFWVLLAKRPELKENPTPTPNAPSQDGAKP